MATLSPSLRAKRGFHRVGVSLGAALGASILAIGIYVSLERVNSQQGQFLALRCADEKLIDAHQIRAVSGPWEEYRRHASPTPDGLGRYKITTPEGTYDVIAAAGSTEKEIYEKVQAYLTKTGQIRIDQLGCGDAVLTASASDVAASRNSGFSYSAALAIPLGVAVLSSGLVALLAYFSVAAVSWIVRGFMRD